VGFAVKMGKGDFIRRADWSGAADLTRRLTCLTIDDPSSVVMGRETVYDGDCPVGCVTCAVYGYTIGKGIAHAWLPAELATTGRVLNIGCFDQWIPAVVTDEPLFDPKMQRLRG
jgi:dimethylglycine oxidase